ncbi:MAG: hypothetical protein WBF58_11390 [Xanthobacteraceae bacterium]
MRKSEPAVQREVSRAIERWLLSILRFAITLEEVDRAAVVALAADMDRRGSKFTFFARTSVAVCNAIIAKDSAEATAALRVFVHAIDHARLKRAVEAVLEINPSRADRRTILARNRGRLWQGLPSRGSGTASFR